MSYDAIVQISQLVSGAIFLSVLIGVAIYAFKPANRGRFEHASRIPLDKNNAPNNR